MQHGRAQVQDVEIGGTRDGKVTGLKVRVIADCGAYPADAALMPMLTGLMSCGVYEIPKVDFHFDAVVTNTTPIGAYRGAGRPEATALVERAIDMFAAEIGMDPAEVRRNNFISEFPHQTVTGANYDSGDYDAALESAGHRGLRRAARRAGGAARARRHRPARDRPVQLRRVDRLRLGARHVRGRGGRHGHRDRGHVLARAGPRDVLRAARGRHARRAARRRARDPVRHGQGRARDGHDGLALAAGRRHRDAARDRRGAREGPPARRAPARGRRRRHRGRPGQGLGVAGSPASAIPWAELAQAAADPARAPGGLRRRPGGARTTSRRRTRRTRSARTSPSSRSTPRPGSRTSCATSPSTTRAGSRTRCWSRARSTAASPRASRRRCSRRSPSTRTATTSPARWRPTRSRAPATCRRFETERTADADAAQPARGQGHRRGGHDRLDARGLERRHRRALAPRRAQHRHAGHAAAGVAGDQRGGFRERLDQGVDVLSVRAEPDARPDRSGQLGVAPGRSSLVQAPGLLLGTPSRWVNSGCAQKQPWRTPIACSSLRIAASAGAVPVELEPGHADAVLMAGPERERP